MNNHDWGSLLQEVLASCLWLWAGSGCHTSWAHLQVTPSAQHSLPICIVRIYSSVLMSNLLTFPPCCFCCILNRLNCLFALFQFCCCFSVAKSCPSLCDPMIAAHQTPLSSTVSQSWLKFMSIHLLMLSNHLILCCPPLLLPSVLLFFLVRT